MKPPHTSRIRTYGVVQGILALCLAGGITACGASSPPPSYPMLPPSASDLPLLGDTRLCDTKQQIVNRWQGTIYHLMPWGSGEQLQRSAQRTQPDPDRFYFFDDERRLVGAVFRFAPGLDLTPYPVLRETLSELEPSSTFYFDPTQLIHRDQATSGVLYRTGDHTSTTQYLVLDNEDDPVLLVASMALDPYEQLLSSYHEKYLPGLNRSSGGTSNASAPSSEATLNPDFLGLQQFARGETALFASCGLKQPTIAVDAYRRSIQHGLKDEARLAEAHHRLGLALQDQGQLPDAQREFEYALTLSPNVPEIINNLGRVLAQQRQRKLAIQLFERALVLRPNFAEARFNLAESLERSNVRRAIQEYETYLALVEGLPWEAKRINHVVQRLKLLKGE